MGRGKHSFLNNGDEHVGVDLPAKPLSSVEARQHAQDFPGLPASLLASTSPQNLCPPSRHANMLRIFQVCQRHCWRRPPRKTFVFRRGAPTCSGFSRSASVIVGVDIPRKTFVFRRGAPTWLSFFRSVGIIVGVDLPAKPLSSVEARQHASAYLDFPVPKNEITCIRKAILICRSLLRR